jgi:uncharacterized protein YdbL (DUF1318 family)
MRTRWMGLFLIIAVIFSFSLTLRIMAQDEDESQDLKARFLQRKPLIDAMKNRGAVGENNVGFLAFRGSVDERERRVVEEENGDRRTVYLGIAGKHGVPVEEVGRRRAIKIAQISPPGHWLQDPQGNWYRK